MAEHLSALAQASKIERRAQKISDPIERLKYLRCARASAARKPFQVLRWTASLVLAIAVAFLGTRDAQSRQPIVSKREPSATPVHGRETDTPVAWPVEQNSQYDLYSNGLRIENTLEISSEPRSYSPIGRETGVPGPRRSQPTGIVFHMTESPQASFEPGQKSALMRIGEGLLVYVRNKRAYHFVIDRFGRVHRIVVESDTANHAGNSVWADSQWAYLDLNASFIGVAFEARTQADQPAVNDPQLHAAKLLTEMLRGKYNLPAENCVTHAQVSVNPGNMRIGWHTDWGNTFAFSELGLPDNYGIPNPALYLFGFEYDEAYVKSTGPGLWKGLASAEELLRQSAADHGLTVAQYRKILQQRYKGARSALKGGSADEEKKHESS
jgi:hypothetical protein